MKGLPRPPSFHDQTQQQIVKILQAMGLPPTQDFIASANREYHHWEKIRHLPPPVGLTSQDAWLAVKLSRVGRSPLPLCDQNQKPFTYWLPDHAQHVLHEVDRQGGGALATDADFSANLPWVRDRVLVDSLMEEAIATSQIEGAVTTRRVAKELLRTGRPPRNHSEKMIVNGYETITMLRKRLDQPLTVDFLHEIQTSMTRGTLEEPDQAGRFRTGADNVHIVDSRDNEVIFTPPPAELLPDRVARLVDFANRSSSEVPFIHPLVKAAILHFWVAYEHPYCDGNGRTARALFYWSMLRDGYWLFEFLTISRLILDAPSRYYRSFLYSEHDENDLTYFIVFQLDVTHRALALLHERVREIAAEQHQMRSLRVAQVQKLNDRQRALLHHALRHPSQVYTFESHQNSQNLNYQTARNDLLKLLELGLLTEIGTGRPREFIAAHDLAAKVGLGNHP